MYSADYSFSSDHLNLHFQFKLSCVVTSVRPTIFTMFRLATVAISQHIHLLQLLWNPLMEETTLSSILGPHLNHLISTHAHRDLD
jgi:hypothetical protein